MQNEGGLHSGGVDADPLVSGTTLSIREVSTLLAVPMPTIRSWERRHALTTVARDQHGHRCYTDDDVTVLRRMRDQRADGRRVHEAAAAAQAPPPLELCRQMLTGTEHLDGEKISAVLDLSVSAHGLPVTLGEVLLPSMREVGTRWSRGQCNIAQEHLATGTVLAWLARRAAETPAPLHDQTIVLSCGPQDQHTIALEAFIVLLRQQRFDCRNLGAQTPAVSLKAAVEQCSAQAVVLVSQLGKNRPAALTALQALRDTGVALFYAGAAFHSAQSRREMPGHYLGEELSQAAAHITNHLRQT